MAGRQDEALARETRGPAKRKGAGKRHYLPAAERRQRILSAAREVFVDMGPGAARTRDLARTAGINEATMFQHFPNKEALFLAAVIEPLQDAMKDARDRTQAFRAAKGTAAKEALGLASARSILASAEALYPMLAVGLFGERETGAALYRDHIHPMLRERGEAIQGALREGVDGEFLSLVIFGIALAVSADRSFRAQPFDVDYLATQMSRILQHGAVSHADPGEAESD